MTTIWPEYLNKNLTLSEGRKVAKDIAVNDPTINDIERALKRLNLQFTIEKDQAYPGQWYEKSGRAIVEWDKSKLELLKEVSLEIKNMRH